MDIMDRSEEKKDVSEEKAELLPDEELKEVVGGASIEHVFGILHNDDDPTPEDEADQLRL